MKEYKMTRKCTIQGCNEQYVEVYYANAQYITIVCTGTHSCMDGGVVALSTARYPSFSVHANAVDTVRGIKDSEFGKCIMKRILVDRYEYYVRKDGAVFKFSYGEAHALVVEQFSTKEFVEIVQGAIVTMCKD